jgi:diacylglycerol kinase family enzyme
VFVTKDVAALDDAARIIAAAGAHTVVLAGGDGTFMAGVTAFVRSSPNSLPRFVLAPAGTVATVARNFGQRAGLIETLRRIVRDGSALPAIVRPTLRILEDDGTLRVGFTVGTGLVARFFERYEQAGAGGPRTALSIVARTFVGSFRGDDYAKSVLDPLPCRLIVDDRELESRAFSLIVCSVLTDLGIRMRVTYRGGEDPERPHLVASALTPRELGPQWPRVALGRRLVGERNFDDLVRQFRIELGAEPGPYVLDGDTFRARRITVSAGPQIDVVRL